MTQITQSDQTNTSVSGSARLLAVCAIVLMAFALRVGALMAWRHVEPPDDSPSFTEQALAVELAFSEPWQLRNVPADKLVAERFDRFTGRLASWFYMHRKPPMFSGLIGLTVTGGRWLGINVERMEAAYWWALAAGMWLLWPAWLILRRLADQRAALAGLAVVAVMPIAVEFSARPLPDTLFATLMLFSVNALLDGLRPGSHNRLLNAGVLTGLAFLTRSEAILLIPVAAVLLALAAFARRVSWAYALAGTGIFLGCTLALAGPYVACVSRAEGRFTIRRNAGNLLRYDLGQSQVKTAATAGDRIGELDAVREHGGRILTRWPRSFAKSIYDGSSQMLGYVGMLFVVVGLLAERRRLLRFGPWQMCAMVYLLMVAMISIFAPRGQILFSPLLMLAPLMGIGLIAWSMAVIRWNPGRLVEPQRAMPWIVAMLIATLTVPTIVLIIRAP